MPFSDRLGSDCLASCSCFKIPALIFYRFFFGTECDSSAHSAALSSRLRGIPSKSVFLACACFGQALGEVLAPIRSGHAWTPQAPQGPAC